MSEPGFRYFRLTLFCGHQTRCLATSYVPEVGRPAFCRSCRRWIAITHRVDITR